MSVFLSVGDFMILSVITLVSPKRLELETSNSVRIQMARASKQSPAPHR